MALVFTLHGLAENGTIYLLETKAAAFSSRFIIGFCLFMQLGSFIRFSIQSKRMAMRQYTESVRFDICAFCHVYQLLV